jgi:hypothetical protein
MDLVYSKRSVCRVVVALGVVRFSCSRRDPLGVLIDIGVVMVMKNCSDVVVAM